MDRGWKHSRWPLHRVDLEVFTFYDLPLYLLPKFLLFLYLPRYIRPTVVLGLCYLSFPAYYLAGVGILAFTRQLD